jgi:hypothetical protein
LSEVDEQLVWVSGALEERELPLGLVEQLVDALARRGGGGGLSGGEDRGVAPAAVGAELLGALGEIAGRVVLVVDDLH